LVGHPESDPDFLVLGRQVCGNNGLIADRSVQRPNQASDNSTSKAVIGRFGLTGLTDFVVTYKTRAFTRQLDGRAYQRTLADISVLIQ
jgi:hypothetical protein